MVRLIVLTILLQIPNLGFTTPNMGFMESFDYNVLTHSNEHSHGEHTHSHPHDHKDSEQNENGEDADHAHCHPCPVGHCYVQAPDPTDMQPTVYTSETILSDLGPLAGYEAQLLRPPS